MFWYRTRRLIESRNEGNATIHPTGKSSLFVKSQLNRDCCDSPGSVRRSLRGNHRLYATRVRNCADA